MVRARLAYGRNSEDACRDTRRTEVDNTLDVHVGESAAGINTLIAGLDRAHRSKAHVRRAVVVYLMGQEIR